MRRIESSVAALALAVACSACGDAVEPWPGLPSFLRLDGTASGEVRGISAECVLELALDLEGVGRREGEVEIYRAEWGGAVQRTVLDAEGDGFSFWLHMHDPEVEVRIIGSDSIEIDLLADPTGEGRFYRDIAVMTGAYDGAGRGGGAWLCSPLDIWESGYVDTVAVVTGRWSVSPQR